MDGCSLQLLPLDGAVLSTRARHVARLICCCCACGRFPPPPRHTHQLHTGIPHLTLIRRYADLNDHLPGDRHGSSPAFNRLLINGAICERRRFRWGLIRDSSLCGLSSATSAPVVVTAQRKPADSLLRFSRRLCGWRAGEPSVPTVFSPPLLFSFSSRIGPCCPDVHLGRQVATIYLAGENGG